MFITNVRDFFKVYLTNIFLIFDYFLLILHRFLKNNEDDEKTILFINDNLCHFILFKR